MELNLANIVVPSLWSLILLWLEVVLVMAVSKFILNKYFPNAGLTTLNNMV